MHTVKWFQILLCITNNSVKHQSFVYTSLNDQFLFLIIQFSASHLFGHSLNIKQSYLTHIGPYQVLLLWVRVDLGAMAMKEYFTFSKAGASPWFNVISRTLAGTVFPSAEMQSVYSTAPANWASCSWCPY